MKFFLLDGGGAFLVISVLVIFMAVAIVLEALVLILFKIEKAGKAFLYSLVVNLASLGVGYVILPLLSQLFEDYSTTGQVLQWLIIFAITVVVEGYLLILLSKMKPRKKLWTATFVMNLLSYAFLLFFTGVL